MRQRQRERDRERERQRQRQRERATITESCCVPVTVGGAPARGGVATGGRLLTGLCLSLHLAQRWTVEHHCGHNEASSLAEGAEGLT